MVKKILFNGIFLCLTGQTSSIHAMLIRQLGSLAALSDSPLIQCRALSTAQILQSNRPAQQRRISNLLHTSLHTATSGSQSENRSRWRRWCSAIATLIGFGTAAKNQKAHANETPEQDPLYYNNFLKRAGFHEALPYWYLAAYAAKMNNIPLREGLRLKIINDENVPTYQPHYLGGEIIPVWTGVRWDRNGDLVYGPGITIAIIDAHNNEIASCSLSAAGKVSNVLVNSYVRGKGLGTLLLSTVKKLAFEAGIKQLYVHVYPYNLSFAGEAEWDKTFDLTVAFYQKNGFVGDHMFCAKNTKKDHQIYSDYRIYSDYSRMVCVLSE